MSTLTRPRAPFSLDEAKLASPAAPPSEVLRTGLVERLLATQSPLVTVVAPAGYGKTTLLRQWEKEDPRPFAWVTLDESDDDPTSCLAYLAAAFDSVEPLAADVFDALSAPESMRRVGTPRLALAFASTTTPMVLVLDDLDRVGGRESLDAIGLLCDRVPQGSTVVLSSRTEPPVGLGRLRARVRLLELGANDLSLDRSEASTLLESADVRLETDEVTEMWERTEGWAAGLYLGALALRSGGPTVSVRELRGDDSFIGDFFREELLQRLSPDDAEFLTATSVLDQLSAPLCDAILERTDSAERLDRLTRSNQFVLQLDRNGQRWRYHTLFRDLLGRELRRQGDERVRTLNHRAALWTLESGDPETAIRYAAEARDHELLDGLIQRAALPVYNSGRIATATEWLGWFDDDRLLEQHTPVAVLGAWGNAYSGRPHEAERWLRAAELGADGYTGQLVDRSASVASWVAVLRAGLCPDGPERMRADSEQALESLAPGSMWRRYAHLLLGCAARMSGDSDAAEREWDVALELAQSAGADPLTTQVMGQRALLALERGDLAAAREMLAVVQMLPGPPLGSYATHGMAVAALARLSLVEGDHERAGRELMRAQSLRPLLTWALPWGAVRVRLELAHVALGLLDEVACRTLLMEIKEIQARRPSLGVLLDDIARLETQVGALTTKNWNWAASLTAAELRILPLLATYLTLDEIGERLFLSRHTVTSHVTAIYRKLGASSRSEAVERAVELGLLDASVFVPRVKLGHNG